MTFGRDTEKSIWWNLLTFWKARKRRLFICRFIWVVLVLIIKLSKTHQKAGMVDKGWLCAAYWRMRVNQCTPNQSCIRGALSLEGLDWTERHDWQMIFICNIMDYNCCDELIIMLVPATMKKVTAGQSSSDPCLLKMLIIKLERGVQEVKCGPVVVRWSLCNSV